MDESAGKWIVPGQATIPDEVLLDIIAPGKDGLAETFSLGCQHQPCALCRIAETLNPKPETHSSNGFRIRLKGLGFWV